MNNKLLKISCWTVVVLFAIRCALSWESLVEQISVYDIFGYAGEAISVAAIVVFLYEKWLWRFNPLEKMPKLHKNYEGVLKSSYDNIERDMQLEIKQTLTSVHVTMITNESRSNSISATIIEVLGEYELIYSYLNTPKSEFRYRSEIHFGTATFSLSDVKILTGKYYTDRDTNGDMNLKIK